MAGILPTIVLQSPCAGCTFKIIKQEEGLGSSASPDQRVKEQSATRPEHLLQYSISFMQERDFLVGNPYLSEQEEA